MKWKMQSAEINEIAAAIAAAQLEMSHAHKDSNNPHFKSKFASLASVIDAAKEGFSKHKLAFIQTMQAIDKDLYLVTMLLHPSGQWLKSYTPVLLGDRATPQVMGAAISYARRYALSAFAGISQEDDDGETGEGRGPVAHVNGLSGSTLVSDAKTIRMQTKAKPKAVVSDKSPIEKVLQIAADCDWTVEHLKRYITPAYHAKSSQDLSESQLEDLTRVIRTYDVDTALKVLDASTRAKKRSEEPSWSDAPWDEKK